METISGLWLCNDTITIPDVGFSQNVNIYFHSLFLSGDKLYHRIYKYDRLYTDFRYDKPALFKNTRALTENGTTDEIEGDLPAPMYDCYGWSVSISRIVYFGTTPQAVSDEFYEWFTRNANPAAAVCKYFPYHAFNSGETVTFACGGKKMPSMFEMFFGSNGSITYNGVQKNVSEGQCVYLHCKNKMMKTDLVVSL